jgi:succinate dehydrogenase/fumarate reductase-like Fe-S protein
MTKSQAEKLYKAALAWKASVAEERCGACGARVHRTPEELTLESLVTTIEETEKTEFAESEAKTKPKAGRMSSRPPKKG